MRKISDAQLRAKQKYDDKAYFKTLVRFPIDLEDRIRMSASSDGRSLNNFIVSAVCKAAGLPEPILKEPGNKKLD